MTHIGHGYGSNEITNVVWIWSSENIAGIFSLWIGNQNPRSTMKTGVMDLDPEQLVFKEEDEKRIMPVLSTRLVSHTCVPSNLMRDIFDLL